MILKLILVLLLGSVLISCEEESFSVELSLETFDNKIKENNYFVMFFAPWCGHCKRLHPIWEKLAQSMKDESNIVIAKVDCTIHQELCAKHEVTGYPTLRFFKLGASESVKFKGIRDFQTMKDFIQEQLGENASEDQEIPASTSKLTELNDDTFAKHIAKGKHFVKFYAPWCSHCQKLAPTWEELSKSLEYDESIKISKIDCTLYRPICQDFEVKSYPTLLWIEDGKKIEKYSGKRDIEDLKAYVEKQAQGESVKSKDEKKEEQEDEEAKTESDTSSVVQLTGNSFEHGIEKGVTFVKFYAPWCGHCQKLSPIWEQLAVKIIGKNDIKIAKVDCTLVQNKELCGNQQVEGYPTLFIYKNGEKLEEYNGSRNLDDLYFFVLKFTGHDEL